MRIFLFLCLMATLSLTSFAGIIPPEDHSMIEISRETNDNKNDNKKRDRFKNAGMDTYRNIDPSNHPCHSPKFKYTAENLDKSQAVEHFERLVDILQFEFPKDFKAIGLTRLWGLKEWGDENFDCDMDGCRQEPSCETIFDWKLKAHNGSVPQATDATRKTWLSLRKLIAINRYLRLSHDILLEVQENVVNELPDLIARFMPQKHDYKKMVCGLKRAFLSALIGGLSDAAAAGNVEVAKKAFAPQITQQAIKALQQIMAISQKSGETTDQMDRDVQQHELNRAAGDDRRQFYESMENDDCYNLAYGKTYGNFQKLIQFGSWLGRKFEIRREYSHYHWNAVNDGTGKYGITMVSWMKAGHFPSRSFEFKDLKVRLPRLVAKRVQQSTISVALAASNCYVKCATHEAGDLCEWTKNPLADPQRLGANMKELRVCFGEEGKPSDMACQVQCWNQNQLDYEVDLYGWTDLKTYGLSVSELIQSSREMYYKYHNMAHPGEVRSLQLGSSGYGISAFLPTCISRTVVLNMKAFPISCGGPDSNDTMAFLNGIYMPPRITDEESEDPKLTSIIGWVVPKVAANFPPLNAELMYCEIQRHFPVKGETGDDKSLPRGKSRHCDSLKSQLTNEDETQANTWFCNSEIFKQMEDEGAAIHEIEPPRDPQLSDNDETVPKQPTNYLPAWSNCEEWQTKKGWRPLDVMDAKLKYGADEQGIQWAVRPTLHYLTYGGQPMLSPRTDYSKKLDEEQTLSNIFKKYTG